MAEGGAVAARSNAAFPLPGTALGALLLVALHGPLLALPSWFDEGPFLAGAAESVGAALAMRWLPIEAALLGQSLTAHHWFAFVLEFGALIAIAAMVRPLPRANLAVIAFAAYLVHPWRTESFVRLGSRGVLLGEAFALIAAWCLMHRSHACAFVATIATIAATSAAPGLCFLALPLLVAAPASQRWRAVAVVAGALLGVVLGASASPVASTSASAWCALDLLVRPWDTGLEHVRANWLLAGCGAGALLVVMATASKRRDTLAALLGCVAVVAWAAAPGFRPARTGLEYLGRGATPESWLPLLLLVGAVCALLAQRGSWTRIPIAIFVAFACGGALVHGRRFDPPLRLIDATLEVSPECVELQVLRGQIWLAQGSAAPAGESRHFAESALRQVERALAARPGDPAARTLEVMALALLARIEEARSRSDMLLAAYPDDWRARAARAEVEAIAGDKLSALRWMRAAVAASPTPQVRASAMRLLDAVYRDLRDALADRRYEAARTLAARLAAIAPEELPAQEAYIDTFTLAGELPQALAAAEALFARYPRQPSVVKRLASLHERLGHPDAAERWKALLRELSAQGNPP
ncbi:MAG: hypothetical protein EXS13_12455 [Planctomycetes bacterium]|nr:hypothetical protein [Planctomycetota bacterium]